MAMFCKIWLQYALFDAHIWTVTDSGLKVKALSEIICKCLIVYDGYFFYNVTELQTGVDVL